MVKLFYMLAFLFGMLGNLSAQSERREERLVRGFLCRLVRAVQGDGDTDIHVAGGGRLFQRSFCLRAGERGGEGEWRGGKEI